MDWLHPEPTTLRRHEKTARWSRWLIRRNELDPATYHLDEDRTSPRAEMEKYHARRVRGTLNIGAEHIDNELWVGNVDREDGRSHGSCNSGFALAGSGRQLTCVSRGSAGDPATGRLR